jgi:phosphatidylethanolamine/phosphatidyl-N-methylethanolamine N-methyltransferase
MKMTNRWNRTIYRLWAPVYDSTVNHFFMPGRKRALEVLGLQPGERVLISGVGTGADLPLLPEGVEAVGVDLSPEMLLKAKHKIPGCQASIQLVRGDSQTLLIEKASFHAAILNLVLSVVPDGRACLESTLLALKTGGRVVVFDKFLPEESGLTLWRRSANIFSTIFGTDITRRFSDLLSESSCEIICNEPALLRGAYRVILIQKNIILDGAPPNKHQQYY